MRGPFNVILLIWLMPLMCIAGNAKREQAYADVIKQSLAMGDVVTLKQQDRSFVAIHTQTLAEEPLGTAIILHDREGFPDQREVVHSLRTTLPQHRWNTLALQMPLREAGATEAEYYDLFSEAKARIAAGLAFLRQEGEQQIVIVGYGLGALMGLYSVSEDPQNVAALVAISLAAPETNHQHAQTLAFVDRLQMPLLDIYAEYDLPAVVNSARKRRLAALDNPDYRQDELDGADHLFRHNDALLSKRVYSWLTRGFMER